MGLTHRRGRLLWAAIGAALWLSVMPSSSGAVVVHEPNGQFIGITPHRGVAPASIPGSVAARAAGRAQRPNNFAPNGNMDYHGGPVVHESAPVLVFWDPNNSIPQSSRSLFARYFEDVAADSGSSSNPYAVARQYTDTSGFADYRQLFSPAQAIADIEPYPPNNPGSCPDVASAFPTCVSDAQLQSELARLIAADGLPTGIGPVAPVYLVVLPTNVNVCTPPGATPTIPCADNVFCAYHSAFIAGGAQALYATIPMLPVGPGQNPKACQPDGNTTVQQPNGDPADVILKGVSHEDIETLTDPLGTGWWDSSGSNGNEVGDSCNAAGPLDPNNGTSPNAFYPALGGSPASGTLFNELIGGHEYYVQSEWSNGDGGCALRPSAGTVTAVFSGPASPTVAGVALRFDPSGSVSGRGYSSATWNFGDGSAPVFTAAGGPLAVTHAFAQDGSYTVTLTLVDPAGNLSAVAHQVRIDEPPIVHLAVVTANPQAGRTVSFSGASSQDFDGSVVSYRWTFGDGTSGAGEASSHTYTNPGTYSVSLTVTDSGGGTATATVGVRVAATITKVASQTRGGQTYLLVTVDGPGVVSFRGYSTHLRRARTASFPLSLSSVQRRLLAQRHTVVLTLTVMFKPDGGALERTQQRLTLRL